MYGTIIHSRSLWDDACSCLGGSCGQAGLQAGRLCGCCVQLRLQASCQALHVLSLWIHTSHEAQLSVIQVEQTDRQPMASAGVRSGPMGAGLATAILSCWTSLCPCTCHQLQGRSMYAGMKQTCHPAEYSSYQALCRCVTRDTGRSHTRAHSCTSQTTDPYTHGGRRWQ